MSEKKIDDGGPAFPHTTHIDGLAIIDAGMTLRDYFAAKAMQGAISFSARGTSKSVAEWSYEMADEMIKARESK